MKRIYSRCLEAHGAHPIGSGGGASVTRDIVLAARFADALPARLAQCAAVDDAPEPRPAAGAAPSPILVRLGLRLLGTRLPHGRLLLAPVLR